MIFPRRAGWTCPVCEKTFHVIPGRDHMADHLPDCEGKKA